MRKMAIVLIVLMMVNVILLSGCVENKPSTTTLSAKSLNLALDDLPGYVEYTSSDSNPELFSSFFKPNESNRAIFGLVPLEQATNWSKSVDSAVVIFNSTSEAEDYFGYSSSSFPSGSNFGEVNNTIGDESRIIREWSTIENESIGYACCFRISNVVVIVQYRYLDYAFTVNLSKIIERRIYDAL